MTTMTEQETTGTILEAAAALAEKLCMTREEGKPSFCDDQPVIIASEFGIEYGRIRTNHGDMRTYRFTEYNLNGETMVKETQRITETGWEPYAKVTYFLPEGAVVYTGFY